MLLVAGARPLTLWVEGLTDNTALLWFVGTVVEPLLIVVGILAAAALGLRLLRRALRRVVDRAKEPVPGFADMLRRDVDDEDETAAAWAVHQERATSGPRRSARSPSPSSGWWCGASRSSPPWAPSASTSRR